MGLNKNLVNIILTAALILLITGCTKGGPSATLTNTDYHTGTEGLELEFFEKTAKEMYETTTIQLGITAHNKGAHDIDNGYISLNQDDYLELVKGDSLKKIVLDGKSIYNPEGSSQLIVYDLKAKELDSQSEIHTSNIIVNACYDYKTTFAEEVCIDSDYYKINPTERACEVKDVSSSSQGGPVAVTNVEVKILPSDNEDKISPAFVIAIMNKGEGIIFKDGLANSVCTSERIGGTNINVVYVRAYLSGDELECNNNPVRIGKDKDNKIECSLKKGISKDFMAYKTNLIVELYYTYMNTISQKIDIKKPIKR